MAPNAHHESVAEEILYHTQGIMCQHGSGAKQWIRFLCSQSRSLDEHKLHQPCREDGLCHCDKKHDCGIRKHCGMARLPSTVLEALPQGRRY
jgi:hypothetical protein